MTVTSHESLFGRLAVQFGLVTMEQLSQATQLQAARPGAARLGDIFIEQGWLSQAEVEALTAAQDSMREKEAQPAAEPPAPAPPSASPLSPAEPATEDYRPAFGAGTGDRLPDLEAQDSPLSLEPLGDLEAEAPAFLPSSTTEATASDEPAAEGAGLHLEPTLELVQDVFADEPAALPSEPFLSEPPTSDVLSPGPLTPEAPVPSAAFEAPAPEPVAPAPAPAAALVPPQPAAPAAPPPTSARPGEPVQEIRVAAPAQPRAVSQELGELLGEALRLHASDLHLHAGCPARFRVNGQLTTVSDRPLDEGQTRALIEPLLEPIQTERLEERGQVDFAYEAHVPGHESPLRMRCNVYRQRLGLDLVARLIPGAPPSLSDLGLPPELARLTNFPQGMVLITGPMGCGKTSTLAALLDLINEERNEHIVTAEDPIEYVFTPKRCVINQREVGSHSHSYSRILRAALREDPDVIAMAELRDPESVELALSAAETGHLVLGTLHTASAIGTVHRILSSFPPSRQEQARTQFAESLRAVVSQRLLQRADGFGQVPALEILMVTQAITNLIRENRLQQIPSQMQTGSSAGMVTLESSVTQLLRDGLITAEEAARYGVGNAAGRPSPGGRASSGGVS